MVNDWKFSGPGLAAVPCIHNDTGHSTAQGVCEAFVKRLGDKRVLFLDKKRMSLKVGHMPGRNKRALDIGFSKACFSGSSTYGGIKG